MNEQIIDGSNRVLPGGHFLPTLFCFLELYVEMLYITQEEKLE